MALTKEHCKQCHNKRKYLDIGWHSHQETEWERGEVDCPVTFEMRSIHSEPPHGCSYRLEYIMRGQRGQCGFWRKLWKNLVRKQDG